MAQKEIDFRRQESWQGTITDPEVYGDLIRNIRQAAQGRSAEDLVRELLNSTSFQHGLKSLSKDNGFMEKEIVDHLLGAEVGDVLAQAGREFRTNPEALKEELIKRVDAMKEYGFLKPAREMIDRVKKS